MRCDKKRLWYTIVLLVHNPIKNTCASRPYIEDIQLITDEGWSSDFPPLPSAFSRILNGVYA